MISYSQWKKRMEDIVPEVDHIGNDFYLLRQSGQFEGEMGPFRADMSIAIIINSGQIDLTIDMVNYCVEAPSMITILPNQIFRMNFISARLDASCVMMSESFSDSLFNEYASFNQLRPSISGKPVTDLRGPIGIAFNKYVDLLKDLLQSPLHTYKLEAAKHLTLSMFYGIVFSIHDMREIKSVDRQTQIFRQFEEELRRHYKTEREVAFYADRLSISPKYLSAIVLGQTGKSALKCINEYTLNECKALLLSTDMTFQQISDRLNFPSQSVFSKFFKRLTGLSPRDYRKQTL